jgi:ribosomal protein S21
MLIINVKRGDIEKSLKELKNKVIKTKQNTELLFRKQYNKKSIIKREIINKARHREKFSEL